MINRTKAPQVQSVVQPPLHNAVEHQLQNGIKLYEVNLGTQEVVKLELTFKAGRWFEQHKLIAKTTSQLLKAGTTKHSAEELADFFEFYGAKLKVNDGFSTVNVELYCLTKHLEDLLPRLYEMVTEPAFEQGELDKYIKRNAQNLKIQLQKSDVVAYRVFTEQVFGEDHPYGYNSNPELYKQVTVDKIKAHFKEHFVAENCSIFVSGKIAPSVIQLIDQYFGKLPKGKAAEAKVIAIPPPPAHYEPIHQNVSGNNLQASIRVGRLLFSRQHPDWDKFYMMNMVLGGYFGARLMQNLREENGYTYGVYSSVETLRYSGYWYIHTDVGRDVKDLALAEIYHEIQRLQEEPVGEAELEMVKNYTSGMLLTSLDGVFSTASVIKSLIVADLSHQYFYDFTDCIKNITAAEIQEMAQKYLSKKDLLEVVVD